MAQELQDQIDSALSSVLSGGERIQQGDMSVGMAPLRDIYAISIEAKNRGERKTGRRPLFRQFNLGAMS